MPFIIRLVCRLSIALAAASCGGGGGPPATPPQGLAADVPLFQKPFAADYPVANFFDHSVPKEFVDTNGTFLTFWGESSAATIANLLDGHEGYDFWMPTGTPLLAVAAGRVVQVTDVLAQPFFCPPLNRFVDSQKSVAIEHGLPDGRRVWSWYTHMDRTDVALGAIVSAGQPIGVSGNTGCSTGPHLHFEVFLVTSAGRLITIDPWGWRGTASDPWEQHADGAPSIQLWLPGQAPKLERSYTFDLNSVAAFAPVFLTKVVYQGVQDDVNPNNESLELTLDSRIASAASLDGYSLRFAKAGVTYAVPAGITLTAQRPTLRVHVGAGVDTNDDVYMGRASGILSNVLDDCVRVVYPNGSDARFNLGACP